MTYELATGSWVEGLDLLASDAPALLSPAVQSALNERYVADGHRNRPRTHREEVDASPTAEGLRISFLIYELGPFAMGMPTVELSWAELRAMGIVPAGGVLDTAINSPAG